MPPFVTLGDAINQGPENFYRGMMMSQMLSRNANRQDQVDYRHRKELSVGEQMALEKVGQQYQAGGPEAAQDELMNLRTQGLGVRETGDVQQLSGDLNTFATGQRASQKQAVEMQQQAALKQEYDNQLGALESINLGPDERLRKAQMKAWVGQFEQQSGVALNKDVTSYILSLKGEEQRMLLPVLRGADPKSVMEVLANPNSMVALDGVKTFMNHAYVEAGRHPDQQSAMKYQSPTAPMDSEADQVNQEMQRSLRLLRIDPSNAEARQSIGAARKRLIEIQQRAQVAETESTVSPDEVTQYAQDFNGEPWNSAAQRVMDLNKTYSNLGLKYGLALGQASTNPAAAERAKELGAGMDRVRARMDDVTGQNKLTDADREAITQMMSKGEMPGVTSWTDPVVIAQVVNDPRRFAQIRERGAQLAAQREGEQATQKEIGKERGEQEVLPQRLSRISKETTARERVQAQYSTSEANIIARGQTGKVFGDVSQQEAVDVREQALADKVRVAEANAGINKPLPPEQAGKFALVLRGIDDVQEAQGMLIKNGKVDRGLLAQMETGLWWSEGRQLDTALLEAIWAQVRPETGAAMSPGEETGLRARYIPTMRDNDKTVTRKLASLNRLFATEIVLMDPQGVHRKAVSQQIEPMMKGKQPNIPPSNAPRGKQQPQQKPSLSQEMDDVNRSIFDEAKRKLGIK